MSFGTVAKAIVAPIFKIFYPMQIEGLEYYDMKNPFVLCANHQSNLDVFSLYIASPRQVHFMAKAELFKHKPLAWLFRKLGAFPVKRNQTDITAIKNALKVLKDGHVLGIFPQGTRVEEIEDDGAKAGAVVIANKAKVPVIPAAIITKYKIFKPIKVKFGKPMLMQTKDGKMTNEELKQSAAEMMRHIRLLWEEGTSGN